MSKKKHPYFSFEVGSILSVKDPVHLDLVRALSASFRVHDVMPVTSTKCAHISRRASVRI